jgi:hypothetical protein
VSKDQKEILKHKKRVIEEIKKTSIQEFLDKRKVTEEEPKKENNSWWKKVKNMVKY